MKRMIVVLLALFLLGLNLTVQAGNDGRGLKRTDGAKRVALVIGNGNYQHTEILKRLSNPTHDAEDIAAALRGFGFEVIEKKDLGQEGMRDAITEFSRKIVDSDAALFYYAGHGLQVRGRNFLVPVDAKIETEAQAGGRSIDLSEILEEMDNAKSRVNIVMLDACRSNDFSGIFRSGSPRGLAAPSSQPKGTVIVYATDPGNVAADGKGRNGLFTSGLLTAFKGGDLSLHGVLVRASEEVERGSGNKQTPYINGPATLQKNFHFAGGTQVASLEPVPVPQPTKIEPVSVPVQAHLKSREEIEQEAWESVQGSGNIASIQEYLKQYPRGRFVGQARILIATLKAGAVKPAEPVAPPAARIDAEGDLWAEVQKGGSTEDYRAYLSQYPKGKYATLAKTRLGKLEAEVAQQAKVEREAAAQQARQARELAAQQVAQQEQGAWDAANSSASESGYQAYLNQYPQGRYAALASGRIARLKKEAALAQQQAVERQRQQASTSSRPFQ